MQRLMSLKLLSKLPPRNPPPNTTTLFSQSRPFKAFSHTNPSSEASHFTITWTPKRSCWELLSNPKAITQWVSKTHFRVPRKNLSALWVRFHFQGAHFRNGFSGFNSSFAFHSRGRQPSQFPRPTTDGVIYGLLIANFAVFMLWQIADPQFMSNNFTISLDNFKSGRVHTLITSALSHRDGWHIASNMIGLYFFGMNIGRVFGPEFLLKLYMAGALGGSIFYLVHQAYLALSQKGRQMWGEDPSKVTALGASGAVNAIMLLNIFLFPKATIYLEFIIPVPAILLGMFLIGKDMLRIIKGDSQISGSAHLGGTVVAALAWARVRKGRF